jgi:hypothetical protein
VRPWKDQFKSDLRSDQDLRLSNDLRSDQINFFCKHDLDPKGGQNKECTVVRHSSEKGAINFVCNFNYPKY